MHRCIHAVVHMIQDHADKADIPARFATTKLIEGDENILQQLSWIKRKGRLLEHCIVQMEEGGWTAMPLWRICAMASLRMWCRSWCMTPRARRTPPLECKWTKGSRGKYTGPAGIFFGGCFLIYLTFNLIGQEPV